MLWLLLLPQEERARAQLRCVANRAGGSNYQTLRQYLTRAKIREPVQNGRVDGEMD